MDRFILKFKNLVEIMIDLNEIKKEGINVRNQTLIFKRMPLPFPEPPEGTKLIFYDFDKVSAIFLAASSLLISI